MGGQNLSALCFRTPFTVNTCHHSILKVQNGNRGAERGHSLGLSTCDQRVEGLCRHSGGQGMALDQQYLAHTRNECERRIFRTHPDTPHQTLGHLATCIIVRLWSFSGMIRLESFQTRGSPGREELGSPRPGQERPISGVCSRATS